MESDHRPSKKHSSENNKMILLINAKIWHRGVLESKKLYNWMYFNDNPGTIIDLGYDQPPASFRDIALKEGKLIDAKGDFFVPGLIDAHLHVGLHGEAKVLEGQDLRSSKNLIDIAEKLKASEEINGWKIGSGWDQDYLGISEPVNRHLIDKFTCSDKVILFRNCLHLCTLNSEALRFLGLLDAQDNSLALVSPWKELAQFMKHELEKAKKGSESVVQVDDIGVPTGVIIESGVFQIKSAISKSLSEDRVNECYKAGIYDCLRKGITAIQTNDFNCAWKVYCRIKNMPIRVFYTVPYQELEEFEKAGYNSSIRINDMVFPRRVKIFADGSLGAKTAALRECYKNTKNFGTLIHTDEELLEIMRIIKKKNYQHEIHVIGDKAAEQVLNCLEEVDDRDRPILTHCQILGSDIVKKMKRLGVLASIQPSFVTSDAMGFDDRISQSSRAYDYSYAWKTLIDSGVITIGGSDAPVEDCSPFLGMHAAIFRTYSSSTQSGTSSPKDQSVFKPSERLSFDEAIDLYTRSAAFSVNREKNIGQLEPGYSADFVRIDKEIWKSSYKHIGETYDLLKSVKVLQVWVAGKLRYTYGDKMDQVFD